MKILSAAAVIVLLTAPAYAQTPNINLIPELQTKSPEEKEAEAAREKAYKESLRKIPGVSSIQITFHQDKPSELHTMPPGGFRLAIVNVWDLQVGFRVRNDLALRFWPTHPLHPSQGPGSLHCETPP